MNIDKINEKLDELQKLWKEFLEKEEIVGELLEPKYGKYVMDFVCDLLNENSTLTIDLLTRTIAKYEKGLENGNNNN